MKKLFAIILAAVMLAAFASCGGPEETESKAESQADVVSIDTPSVASVEVISIPSVPSVPDVPEIKNLALDGTPFDMNTGKSSGDEGYVPYYTGNDRAEYAFDGNLADPGWQPKGTDDEAGIPVITDETLDAGLIEVQQDNGEFIQQFNNLEGAVLPEDWYMSDDGTELRRVAVNEDGTAYVGVKFDEAVKADTVVLVWENGSVAETYENGGFYLQYTTDGETWEKLEATVERGEDNGTYIADTATFEAIEVTGIRVMSVRCTNKWNSKLYEMQIFAPEEAEEAEGENADDTAAGEDAEG